ncbi:MAG: ABC-F family ATP-binding cassette domain-containing protein [Bacilli bacterium]|nr:ABC-F family ATP-binding cassette domain-containing protein [Bacilli bacterium]
MSVIEIENLKFTYGEEQLYNNASVKIFEGEHVGLVGKNGSGKSTLLNLIARKLSPDSGSIILDHTKTFTYLDQHLQVDNELSISDYLYDVYKDLFKKEEEMNKLYESLCEVDESQMDKILSKAEKIQEYLEEKEFYSIKSKIQNVIVGLGIDIEENRKLRDLSGGQRAKVFLGKMLLEEKDVLLLDEPTNFLDYSHVEWLSKYLVNYKNAFLVISHNFDFLNSVCNVIVALENKVLTKYKGNYDAYLSQRDFNLASYIKAYNKQQEEIKKEEIYIQKNIVRASTTKMAQSRRKKLEKMERLEKPEFDKKVVFHFPFTKSFTVDALDVYDLSIGYDGKAILENINLKFEFGKKYAIIGANGIGKTTFVKTVLGLLEPIKGKIKLAPYNNILYYAQEEDVLDMSPRDYIRRVYPHMDNTQVMTLLASYGIDAKCQSEKIKELSGGEQARMRFALLSLTKSNLLVLDEPTNHLDKNSKEALFQAISEYPGTVILVSHERSFFKKLNMKEISFEV